MTQSVSPTTATLLQELMTTLAKYGLGALFAAFLLWFVTHEMSSDIRDNRVNLGAMRQEHNELRTYLRGICYILADGDATKKSFCEAADLSQFGLSPSR